MAEQITAYRFDELTAEAQHKAIVKLRQSREWQEEVNEQAIEMFREDAIEELKGYGLPTDDFCFSLTHSQGDGVAFYGDVTYSDDLIIMLEDGYTLSLAHARMIRKYVEAQGHLGIYITRNSYGYRYSHANTMNVELETDNYMTIAENILLDSGEWSEDDAGFEEEKEAYDISFSEAFDALQEAMYTFIRELSVELHDKGYAMIDEYDSDESARAYAEWAYDFPVLTEEGDKINVGW